MTLRIVFHGQNAACFTHDFSSLIQTPCEIAILPDNLSRDADISAYKAADVIIGGKFDASLPTPAKVKLFQVPGAGYDAVQLDQVPASAIICNCFGHEQAISEYIFAAILARHIPLLDADRRLRKGEWAYASGSTASLHGEVAGKTIGLLGFGHIGKAIARRAKAFEMKVTVANRSAVSKSDLVDQSFTLDQLESFWASSDIFVVSVPLVAETTGLVGASAFAAMPAHAVIFNVGRGKTIDQAALFEALSSNRIAGAVIDTWYQYPSATKPRLLPAELPFHTLKNIVMTPHMSGWTDGTIRRRQHLMASNINRLVEGGTLVNIVRKNA